MKKFRFFTIVLLIFTGVIYTSCKDDTDEDVEYGIIKGTVVSLNSTPIGGAKVFVEHGDEILLVLSDDKGKFELEVPEGQITVHIQTGKGNIFRSDYVIDVVANTDNIIPVEKTTLKQVAELAYILGQYDAIENLIIDSLGYEATDISISDLDDYSVLENYSGIFLNCGKYETLDELKYSNLEQFVLDGGSLYASDYAVEYLTGDGYFKFIENDRNQTNRDSKDCIGDEGGFIDDNILCTQKTGPMMLIDNAAIVSEDIQSYLGKDFVDIEYDLGSWEKVEILESPWEVLIEDQTYGYGPLAIRMAIGNLSSKVTKQKNDQEWITICHIPPGNPDNPITITVSINSWPAHEAHGDSMGPCTGTGGTIYFTTFHNHAQGSVSPDIQHLLQYFILNL